MQKLRGGGPLGNNRQQNAAAYVRRVASCRQATGFTPQLLLVLLLPLPRDVELTLLAPAGQCSFPFQLVPIDRELVLDVVLVIPKHPLGGKSQLSVLQF